MPFITFEGVDGGGKTTQIIKLAEHLRNCNLPVCATFEPGATKLGEFLREQILHSERLSELTELMLFLADRCDHVNRIIKPALDNGEIVLCDRYSDSTYAYQVCGRGLNDRIDKQLFYDISSVVTSNLEPDLTFLFDLPVSRIAPRINRNNGSKDRIERSGDSFFEKTRQAYLELAQANPNRWVIIDATKDVDEISKQIIEHPLITKLVEKG